ncbi:MAG: glycosyltransferase family 4 protein [Deltaproteobacteria bacterium]|nr:glycosyltransferase family 4 protein [Deltaproteobacteria bacterium]
MRVLQLFNNWKWTGPAEYAFNLAVMLKKQGIETVIACGRPPEDATASFFTIAQERGLVPVADFFLDKHLNVRKNLRDYRRLRAFMSKTNFSVIHSHLTNGHLLGSAAARAVTPTPVMVRTCYENNGGSWRDTLLYRHATDGVIAVANSTRQAVVRKSRLDPSLVPCIPAAIDIDRFNPRKGLSHNRAVWNIPAEATVVGIVARVQSHRRFHIFLQGIAEAVKKIPCLKVMVIGRGTRIKELAIEPAKSMGLYDHFIFTGYRKDDYVETLNCIDMKVFLVPGSDESCRAVREAMAVGKPVIVARRGMLPEIVDHASNGLVIDDTPENLAQAIVRLVEDKNFRERLGRNAFHKAQTEFSLQNQVDRVIEFYEKLCREKRA